LALLIWHSKHMASKTATPAVSKDFQGDRETSTSPC